MQYINTGIFTIKYFVYLDTLVLIDSLFSLFNSLLLFQLVHS